ncbi:hypothetical protein [Hyalangium versicolor]|uniref:hypothetical protein n=1 Tax=Hyalangium versicolor TaxID=2861190 RepID=UPI001CCF4544|nr:hypothetical protein [Hyalangium versicolor]
MSQDIPNIVVLVGGTVDPGNLDSAKRSLSYPKPGFQSLEEALKNKADSNWYWLGNDHFVLTLETLRKRYTNLHVFTAHGWTGDNSVQARIGAGTYLANRLCGAQGELPYYQAHLKKEVHFHFIGHSHGGNVINELTRQAAKVWPKQWKIRSVTYLSTPFFTQLHQVDTKVFHDDCQIINAFCRYDITQRIIADFSLHPMTDMMKAVGVDEIGTLCTKLGTDMASTQGLFKAFIESLNISFLKEGTQWSELKTVKNFLDGINWKDFEDLPKSISDDLKKVDIQGVHFGKTEATKLYSHLLLLLSRVHDIFTKLRGAVTVLRDGITYDVHKSVDPSGKKTRKVLSGALAAQFIRELDLIEGGLKKTKVAFENRLRQGKFPLMCLADDIYVTEFVKPLITFLEVNPQTLQGPLWNLVANTLSEQIDVFDNTRATPAHQLVGKGNSQKKSFPVVQVEVTSEDAFIKAAQEQQQTFNKFINRLAGIEVQLEGKKLSSSQKTLLDLVFTLVAHMEPARVLFANPDNANYVTWFQAALVSLMLWKRRWGLKTDFEEQVLRLSVVLKHYATIIRERNFGRLEMPVKKPATASTAKAAEEPPVPGSIPYLATVAHSTSRVKLHATVQAPLERQFTTKKR